MQTCAIPFLQECGGFFGNEEIDDMRIRALFQRCFLHAAVSFFSHAALPARRGKLDVQRPDA